MKKKKVLTRESQVNEAVELLKKAEIFIVLTEDDSTLNFVIRGDNDVLSESISHIMEIRPEFRDIMLKAVLMFDTTLDDHMDRFLKIRSN